MSDSEIDEAYAKFREDKEALGLRTTHMRNDEEVNFAEYTAALSEELQKELASYFADGAENRDEALAAQQAIASVYAKMNDNSMHVDAFARAVRSLGYDIEWGTVRTTYIIDDKKSKDKGGGSATEGNITIFTIKNKEGEVLFKVADTNGNAEIEIEEVFANELITGIANEIDRDELLAAAANFKGNIGGGSRSYDLSDMNLTSTYIDSEGNVVDGLTQETEEAAEKENGKYVVNQAQYNKLLNEKAEIFKRMGLEQSDAMANAKTYMSANYTIDNSVTGKAVRAADFSSASNGYILVIEENTEPESEEPKELTSILDEDLDSVLKDENEDKDENEIG